MKYLFIPFVFMASTLLITGVPAVQATVEEGWPAGTPNSCRNADDFFMNFEGGIDNIEIESTIPSLLFTTTDDFNWKYADIRTEQYNIYPYGGAYYETNGNFFAWLGTLGDAGRINFLGGGASYCSVLVSTGSGLTLDAYDNDGTLIATSGWAENNLNTRTFTRLTVEAPAGETIAYVMIHDTGNFWVVDDLCTDANKAVLPVPGRDIGSHDDRIDLVFVPDEDYGAPADIDTWLPDFIDDIQDQIDQRLGAAAPVTGNLDSFNFYYTRVQGDSVYPNHILPSDITRVAPWADAYTILHTETFGDWTLWGPPVVLGAEGAVGRSFIHEAGHGIFGLADEYDDAPVCRTARFEPTPNPNVWDDEADCRADVTAEGWGNPDDCWMFTTCTTNWWKFTTTRFIMDDGTQFANGWGQPSSRRIQGVLDNNPGTAPAGEGDSGEAGKSIWLNIQVAEGEFTLLEESYIVAAAPNNRPSDDTFTIEVVSNGNAVLEKFGMHDPRIVQAEPGTDIPTWRDEANFQVVVPYFPSGGRVDLIESATGNIKLSVDISKYATATAPEAVCQDIEVALNDNGELAILTTDIDGGSYDPEGGPIELSIDKSDFTCADVGQNTVTLTVTDEEGSPAACTATVTVEDTTPPVVVTKDITVQLNADGNASISVDDIDNGSTDNCCLGAKSISKSSFTCADVGQQTVTLTVTDCNGNSNSATATVTVEDNIAPTAVTKDITVYLDADGKASIVAADIDNGSDDNCGIESMSIEPSSFTCADIGANTVTLTVTDNHGNTSTATAMVTVEDNIPPTIDTNAPESIIPPDAPISFTATATDNCSVTSLDITDYYCYDIKRNGKKHSKMQSCIVNFSGDTLTVLDSGGVGDNIIWTVTAADQSGNTTTTEGLVKVINPGKAKTK